MAITVVGSSAVAVAVPELADDLGLSEAAAAWVFTSYLVAFAATSLPFGRAADARGLRGPLLLGAALMAVGSVVAATAGSAPLLVAGRALTGAGAGAIPVVANGVVAATWEGPARSRAFGRVIAVVAVASGSGPLVGGLLTAGLGWRPVIGLSALVVALVPLLLPRVPGPTATHPPAADHAGTTLVVAASLGLALAVQWPTAGPLVGLPATAVTAACGALLVRHVRVRPEGFLPRRIVTDATVVRGGLVGFALLAAYFAALLAVPQLLADGLDLGPLGIGLLLLPAAAAGAGSSWAVERLVAWRGRRALLVATSASCAAALLAAAAASTSVLFLVLAVATTAVAFGAGQAALLDHVATGVPAPVRNLALGVLELLMFVGGAVGPAVVGGFAGAGGPAAGLAAVALLPLAAVVVLVTGRDPERTAPAPTTAPTPRGSGRSG